MNMEPRYRIRVEIYDDEVGEVVSRDDQVMMSSEVDNVGLMYKALRSFAGERATHEMTHYPDGIEEKQVIEF